MEELINRIKEYYVEGCDPHRLREKVQFELRDEGVEFTNDEVWNAIQGVINGTA